MSILEALTDLVHLFPEPEYTSEISVNTRGQADITVFRNTAREWANVPYVDGDNLDDLMRDVREQAEESKRLSREIGG